MGKLKLAGVTGRMLFRAGVHSSSGFHRMRQCHKGTARPETGVRRAIFSLIACAMIFAPGTVRAEDPDDTLTLDEAISKALAEGTAARIARLEADRADHGAKEARAAVLPQVGVTSDLGWSNRYDDTFIALDQNLKAQEYGLATISADRAWLQLYVSQILLDLKQFREIEREKLAAEVAGLAEARDRDEIAFEVLRRYARLVALERKAEIAAEQEREAAWLDEQATHLVGAGRALPIDRNLVRLHATDAQFAERNWEQEIASARAELWLAIGEDEPLRVPIDPDSLPNVDVSAIAYGVVDEVGHSPEMRILDVRRRMELASVGAAKAGRLPTMKFVSGYSHYGPKRYDAYEDELWVGVDVEVPIFDGLRTSHAIKGAQRDAEIARLRYQQTLAEKRARVRELLRRLHAGVEKLDLARDRVEASAEQVRLANLNLKAERGDLGSAVTANENHTRLALEAVDTEYEQVELWASLQREVGRLAFKVLGPVASASIADTASATP